MSHEVTGDIMIKLDMNRKGKKGKGQTRSSKKAFLPRYGSMLRFERASWQLIRMMYGW